MNGPLEVMLLSSDLEARRRLKNILEGPGIDAVCVSSLSDCEGVLAKQPMDLVFCDSHFADGTYRDLLHSKYLADRRAKVVVTSRLADWDEFLDAIRLGAFDMIAAPCQPTEVEWVLSQVVRAQRAERAPEFQFHS
jgi:DNA-binding NtrC family response regulator